jgi:glycosyltransferase involved in cell wall biosynthesis
VKLVVFTPLPPAATGIADYSALLLAELSRTPSGWDVETVSNAEEAERFRAPAEPHEAMYHVGNSVHHDFIYPAILRRPGVLVLHDLVLHHSRLFHHLESPEVRAYREDIGDDAKRRRARERIEDYRAEARAAYPAEGDAIAEIALRIGGGRLLYEYPLYEHLVRGSRLTLVHSSSSRDEILERCPGASVRRVRMGIPLPPPLSREEARRRLGIPLDELILASFGLVTPEKRIPTALRAVAKLEASGISARYVLVGDRVAHYDPLSDARRIGIADRVRWTGRVSDEEFLLHAFAADICLNLRYPSAGETSATLLRLLACGRPVVVTDQVQACDLPRAVVARSSLLGDEDGLYCDLMDLIRSEGRRRDLSRRSREWASAEASPEVMVRDYLDALAELGAGL